MKPKKKPQQLENEVRKREGESETQQKLNFALKTQTHDSFWWKTDKQKKKKTIKTEERVEKRK